MLSKDEILKKKGKSPEQLDLVKDSETTDNKTKNRLLLVLVLILFVGSSVGFSLFRQYKDGQLSFNFSLPSLPQVNIDSKLQNPIDKNSWQICLFDKKTKSLLYSDNCPVSIIPDIPIGNDNQVNLIKPALPNGLTVREKISSSSSEISYFSDIISPKSSFLLSIKIFGSYPLDISQKLIPKLAADLYWQYSQK